MTTAQIPDVTYALSEDGELLHLQQGQLETSYLTLHKIHLQLFAKVMDIQTGEDNASPMLISYLEDINEQAEALYELLNSIPNSHPRDIEPKDLIMARKLFKTANQALSLWGNN